jgi:drug/metabolite transporter (DMT)-like permease
LALGAIWGASFLFIKVGVSELPPLYVSLGRVASGAAVLLVIVAVSRSRLPSDLPGWGHNLVVAVTGVATPFTLFAYGEQRISSMLAGIWNSMTPLIVLPLAVLLFRTEQMTSRRVVGLALGFFGALVILGVWRGVAGSSLSGQLLCLAAAACYGFAIPYTKRFLASRTESGIVMSFCQLLLASVVLGVSAPLVTRTVPDVGALSWRVIVSVLVLGAVGTGAAFVVNLRNIRLVGATTASMVTYVVPVFATAIGVLVLREKLAWFQPVGAVIVLGGVAVSQGVLPLRRAASAAGVTPQVGEPLPVCLGEITDVDPRRPRR